MKFNSQQHTHRAGTPSTIRQVSFATCAASSMWALGNKLLASTTSHCLTLIEGSQARYTTTAASIDPPSQPNLAVAKQKTEPYRVPPASAELYPPLMSSAARRCSTYTECAFTRGPEDAEWPAGGRWRRSPPTFRFGRPMRAATLLRLTRRPSTLASIQRWPEPPLALSPFRKYGFIDRLWRTLFFQRSSHDLKKPKWSLKHKTAITLECLCC